MKICSECGAETYDNANFCNKCGSNFYIECPQCGHKLEKSALFCDRCGASSQENDDSDIEEYESLPEKILGGALQVALTLFMLDD